MAYIPNTDDGRRRMLNKIGVSDFEALLAPIPEKVRLKRPLNLPGPVSELELLREIDEISRKNMTGLVSFAGGGVYDHFIPSAVERIISRPEFMTAYTPYQAEVAQGTLQVIYEFQTHICRLTGLDVANASMYDGASALAEAALLAVNTTKRNKVVISKAVSPMYREVVRTYTSGRGIEIIEVAFDATAGVTDFDTLRGTIDNKTACVIVAQPNFFGVLEDLSAGSELAQKHGALMIAAVDPIAAALLKTPGDCGVDIAVGEGQPLGINLNFGGPLLGFFAVDKKLIRMIPGRLVARTVDEDNRPGFVLTLQTREQHIRRDKATSNICTNQALCATSAAVYLSLLGKKGFKKVALLSMEKTHHAAERICELDGFEPYFKGDFIRETVIKTPLPAEKLIDKMIDEKHILPGISLGRFYSGFENGLLLAATEKRTTAEIQLLVEGLKNLTRNAVLSGA
jgi:glycine dehydrogenase subunit 1